MTKIVLLRQNFGTNSNAMETNDSYRPVKAKNCHKFKMHKNMYWVQIFRNQMDNQSSLLTLLVSGHYRTMHLI